jgi:hypothetical protein
MAYELVNVNHGTYAVDWDLIWRINWNYSRAGAQLDCARVVRESQAGINPMTWGLPDLQYVEVDWERVRRNAPLEAVQRNIQMVNDFARSADAVTNQLKTLIGETRRLQDRFHQFMKATSHEAMKEIERSVSTYGTIVEGLKWVRDTSATILVGIGTGGVGAGGAALGTIAGTGIKAWGKYEDTGNVGLAVVEAGTGVLFSVIPGMKGVSTGTGQKFVKAIISASADTYKGTLEGKSLYEAAANGMLNFATPAVGELAKSDLVKGILQKSAVPVATRLLSGPLPPMDKLATTVAAKLSEDIFKKGGKNAIGWAFSGPKNSQDPSEPELADYLTFADELLVKFAVVDMEKGIGRSSW